MARTATENANEPDAEDVGTVVANIEALNDQLATMKGEYMKACRVVREEQKAEYDTANGRGIRKKLVRSIIKERELDRKKAALKADLEDDELSERDMLLAKLGDFADTDMGRAALAAAAARDGGKVLDGLGA